MNLAIIAAFASCCLTAVCWFVSRNRLRTDWFFLCFFSSTTLFLEVVPVVALYEDPGYVTVAGVKEIYQFPGPSSYASSYGKIQTAALALFQLPLASLYYWRNRRRITGCGRSIRIKARGYFICILTGALSIAFLIMATSTGLIFWRRFGSVGLTERLVSLPAVPFFVIRSFQESAIFLIGILLFQRAYAYGLKRRLISAALIIVIGVYSIWGLLSTRSALVLLVVCLLGWWLHLRANSRTKISLKVCAIGFLSAAAVFWLVTITINLRMIPTEGWTGTKILDPFGVGPLDNQGIMRLNGIDLMARTEASVAEKGPAGGALWVGSTWIVRRFLDPEGFNEFRAGMETTAKSLLAKRYMGIELQDYYSCSLTDLFGNFGWAGFLLGALIYAVAFRYYRSATIQPRRHWQIVIAIFVVTHVLSFDQEMSGVLFGWIRQVPVLALILIGRPFRLLNIHAHPFCDRLLPKQRLRQRGTLGVQKMIVSPANAVQIK